MIRVQLHDDLPLKFSSEKYTWKTAGNGSLLIIEKENEQNIVAVFTPGHWLNVVAMDETDYVKLA